MLEVHLLTGGLEEVTTVKIPPFAALPDVIVWGTRTFQRGVGRLDGGIPYYIECFAFFVVTNG